MELINNAKLRRNLLFCIITSLETDLRSNLIFLMREKLKIDKGIIEKTKERYFYNTEGNTDDIALLIDYMDFGDYSQVINQNINMFSNKKLVKSFSEELEEIIPIRNRVMHNRPLDFNDDDKVLKFVTKLEQYKDIMTFPETKKEIKSIENDPNYLIKINLDKLKKYNSKIKHNLPMVDYDDTGFIGRIKDKEILKNKLLGAYPVITIVGIGGIGKTSLALSCLYDLIEENENKERNNFFDTIIWITLKSNGLLNGDFKKIKEAITSLDKNFQELNINGINILSVDEILEYMKRNRTLLVIDNFETLTEGDVDKLFDEIPNGSKILVTSRKAIGNYERSMRLEELDNKDALNYFRKLANIYKVDSLIKQKDEVIIKYLNTLKNSPLAIKWFVINVGKGSKPESIMNNKFDDLTNFCLSNIYEKLSDNAKYVLRVILRKKNKCEQAEIVFISELDYIPCASAIEELFGSNFLQQNEDYTYSIPEFTVNYIQSQRDFSTKEQDKSIQININKLNGSLENLVKDIHLKNDYHPLSLFPKTNSEKIATLYVLKAIESSKRREYNKIDEYFSLAKDSSPQFSDIYKIAGYIYSKFNILNAEINYEKALSFSEHKAPIHYFYGGFLMNIQNYDRAELELREAIELEPDNELIKLKMARLYKMQNIYEKSIDLLNSIDTKKQEFEENRMQIKYIFEMIDTRIRFAESLLDNNNNKALSLLNDAIEFIDDCNSDLFDFTIYNSMFRLLHIYIRLLSLSSYDLDDLLSYIFKYHTYILAVKSKHKKEERFNQDLERFKNKISSEEARKINDILNYKGIIKQRNIGHVVKLYLEKGYGFITPMSYSYQMIYFHCSQFKGDFRKLYRGDRVSFELSVNKNKVLALNVVIENSDIEKYEEENELVGIGTNKSQ